MHLLFASRAPKQPNSVRERDDNIVTFEDFENGKKRKEIPAKWRRSYGSCLKSTRLRMGEMGKQA